MIVVDSNVLASRMLSCERTFQAIQVESLDNVWLVPCLWRYEFLNILATQIKAGRISQQRSRLIFQQVAQLLVENERDPDIETVLGLVAKHRITAYDAHFVALAQTTGSLLVTEDAELLNKFPDCAISMEAFISRHGSADRVREASVPYLKRKNPSSRLHETALLDR